MATLWKMKESMQQLKKIYIQKLNWSASLYIFRWYGNKGQ